MGIANLVGIGLICLYTAYLIVEDSEGFDDFMDTCKKYMGRPGQYLAWISSMLVLIGNIDI